ncbi:sugar-binding transcriptional regulator [Xylocopilactobacillus apicola]|uniref:Citrate lyase n=1 Tax=Xylocopilactobacillus apicola TaxID=2932184 RepID=A0AAU9D9P8_9LACO|nr:sugar-binding domain-containing protein [Xylocopilactobacillus apicola]BDR59090.1 citrate lyase [Xylocopilactobacillus apicola]
MSEKDHQDLLIGIAQGFYYSRSSISELAKKFNTSRYYVEKYLDEATNSGLVNISIQAPVERQREMETQFQKVFPNHNITIIKDTPNQTEAIRNVFLYSAREIQHSIQDNQIIGLSWGETMYDLIQHFSSQDRPDLTFIQIMGENMKYESKAGSTRMVEMAANRLGAKYHTIVAPLYVFDPKTRNLLAKEPAIAPTLDLGDKVDQIICSVGTFESIDAIPIWQEQQSKIIAPKQKNKVAGFLFGRPYDQQGHFIDEPNVPVFSIPIDQIMATNRRVAVVADKLKTEATLGAIRGNLLNTLYLSESVASKIISIADEFK